MPRTSQRPRSSSAFWRFSRALLLIAILRRLKRRDDPHEETAQSAKTPRPDPDVLRLMYDEVAADLKAQQGYIEDLNGRAQQLFSFSTVILAIVAAVIPTKPSVGTQVVFACAVPFFALSTFFSARAWEFRKWHFDPRVDALWEKYRLRSEEYIRHQVILNRLAAIDRNLKLIEPKRRQIKRSRFWLYLGFIYLVALLLVRVVSG